VSELAERKIAAQDQLRRVELRAPIPGIVHELGVHTVGGVISAGEPVMLIVPSTDLLTIEVRIAPADIDQVAVGQTSVLRFPAFNQRTTPELAGTVTRVAADLTRETQTGQTFYIARIKVDDASEAHLGGLKLVPGMPVEAFIATGERTALSYLVKPFTDQFARAFREE
jgi:HlyD family secretion protein